MNLLTVDTLEEARAKLLKCLERHTRLTETVSLAEARGRVLATDLPAPEDIPAFRRSTVDGYVVRAADTAGASEAMPVALRLAGRVEMGQAVHMQVRAGECALVPTGGMVPEGADAVVMVEYTEPFGDDEIAVSEAVGAGTGIAMPGEDARQGTVVVSKGRGLGAAEIGALSAAGITAVPVFVPLRIAIVSTGDELVPPAERPKVGQVRDVNTFALRAAAEATGFMVTSAQGVKDSAALLETTVRGLLAEADLVAVSGGSSQGEHDATSGVFAKIAGGVLTHGLALKPGKPTILAFDRGTSTVLLGLPGHPVAALMVFELLLGWAWRRLTGQQEPPVHPAVMSTNVPGAPGRTSCVPVRLCVHEGVLRAEPIFGKSGMITTLTKAEGYVMIDRNKEGLKKGEGVSVLSL